MASIRRRRRASGDFSYAVLFRANKRQHSETFYGPGAEAEAAKFKRLVERIGGEAAMEVRSVPSTGKSGDVPNVTDWVYHHIEHLTGVEEGTRSDYRSYVRLSIADELLGSLPVDVVTRDHAAAWINALDEEGLSGKTIKNRHSLLSAAFSRAVIDGLRADNPAKGIALPKSEREDMVFLTPGEFAILLAHVPRHWQPLVSVLAGTGLRWSEATALQVRDVHLDDDPPTLTVVRAWKHTDSKARLLKALPKSKKARRNLGLAPAMVLQLRPRLDGKRHDEFVFIAPRGGPVRHADFLASIWQVAVAKATMTMDKDGNEIAADRRITKRPRIHDLRHTYASWMLALGMSLTELQYAMGHESIKTTSDSYGHMLPGHRERVADYAQIALAQALPELEPPPEIEARLAGRD